MCKKSKNMLGYNNVHLKLCYCYQLLTFLNPLRPDRTNSSCIAKISILK